jgi:hypothetical protein
LQSPKLTLVSWNVGTLNFGPMAAIALAEY